MRSHEPSGRYDAVTRALHWSVALLIVMQVAGGLVLEDLPRKSAIRSFAFDAHESLGIVVLGLLAARIAWRLTHATPAAAGAAWQRLAARGAHVLLYALMIAVPVVGYAMVDTKGYPVAFFWLEAPDLLATDRGLAERLGEMHEALAWMLVAVVALHIAAALWHRWVLRDDVLARMLSGSGHQAG